MSDWDYAELSKAAKEAGGPEKLIEQITESAKNAGRKEMLIICLAIAAVYKGVKWGVKTYKNKKINQQEVETAKAELIKGIKEYDAAHPTENCVNNGEKEGEDTDETR